jgi:signal transduction histidine kinase
MTCPAVAPKKRQTIRQQALLRFGGVMVVLMVGISLIGANSFNTRREREIAQKLEVTREFYAQALPRVEAQWTAAASQLKSRIEFTRILEGGGEIRWAALNTFLTAQWEFLDFSNLILLSPTGDVLYSYGSDVAANPIDVQDVSQSGWHYASSTEDLYRIIQTPIWMGKQGQGSLILFKTLNSSTLQGLVTPETHLHVFGFGRLLASSSPFEPPDGLPGRAGLRDDLDVPVIQIDMGWPHDSAQSPMVVIHREFRESITLNEFMLRPLVAIAMVALMLWLGLGRWLTRSVRRIEALENATRLYSDDSANATAIAQVLGPAQSKHDEIGDVATTLQQMMEQALKNAEELESRIKERTLELSATNIELAATVDVLRSTQKQLVRTEKLAALGAMVAGVSHELNTPLGNALLTISTLKNSQELMQLKIDHVLRKSDLVQFLADVAKTAEIVERNVSNASNLVQRFKEVAVNQTAERKRPFALQQLVQSLILVMKPTLERTTCAVTVDIADDIALNSYPGAVEQVLMNLVANACLHAFEGKTGGQIIIGAHRADADRIMLTVADDGVGIEPASLSRIFDPFFTTKMGRGSTGLGLHIALNFVEGILGGNIDVVSSSAGTVFSVLIPESAPDIPQTNSP